MTVKSAKKVWMNGRYVNWENAKVHILTHALHYGTAIFEGIRCYDTLSGPAVFRMKDHYERLAGGAKTYQFELDYSVDQLCKITKELIRKNNLKSCYIRPICYVGYKTIGLDIREAPFELAVITIPFGKYYGKKSETGISCKLSSWKRIDTEILSPHVKASANYMNSILARKEATDSGYDEAIMLNGQGRVAEGSAENLFIVENGVLVTPPVYEQVLKGITRESVMEIAREMGIPVVERPLLRDELYTAEEVFLTGTAAEITPVAEIDKRKITKGKGPITRELHNAFFKIVQGKDERFMKWLDHVNQ
ncbi:branched-chain amino acid transaminase [Candidatus Micrarchaeota archaeon]|nr:branched-chain amino acid transaminase [Candidatus Micrarchaeota archaeon]